MVPTRGYHSGAVLKPDSKRLSPILLGLSAVLIFVLGCANQGGFVERADRTNQGAATDDAARFLAGLHGRHTAGSQAWNVPRLGRLTQAGWIEPGVNWSSTSFSLCGNSGSANSPQFHRTVPSFSIPLADRTFSIPGSFSQTAV